MPKKKTKLKKQRKKAKKKAAKRKVAPRPKRARQRSKGHEASSKRPSTSDVARKKRAPRRRSLRIKKHKGPFQMGLPLQMPLALGREAFAERPVVVSPADDSKPAPRAPPDQKSLFS